MPFVTKPFIILVIRDFEELTKSNKKSAHCCMFAMEEEKSKISGLELFLRIHKQYQVFYFNSSPLCMACYCAKKMEFGCDNPILDYNKIEQETTNEVFKLEDSIRKNLDKYFSLPDYPNFTDRPKNLYAIGKNSKFSPFSRKEYKNLFDKIGLKEYKTKETPSKVTLEDAEEWPY